MSTTPRTVRRTVLGLLIVVLGGVAARQLMLRPVHVQTHVVATGEVRGEVAGTGTLEARFKTTVSPRIQERLVEVPVDQGDTVRSGQLLAKLDDAELQRQLAVAEATLAAARATVERVRTDEARAKAVLEQAQLSHRRSTELLAGKIAAQADFDRAAEALRVAEADLERSRSVIVEAERLGVAAEKNLLYHQERLRFTEIRSPYDGLVIRRDRDPGDVVVPGASILEVVSTNEIWVSAWVDETARTGLKTGQTARVVFRSEPGRGFEGEVARLGRETDRETREFVVDVRLKQLPADWTLGQRAEVYIENGRATGRVVVPSIWVSWRMGKPGVFRAEGGRARWREVSLGLQGTDVLETTSGLAVGDQVVRPVGDGSKSLGDGQRIALP